MTAAARCDRLSPTVHLQRKYTTASSQIVGWLSRSQERWIDNAPSARQDVRNIDAVRVEGPDPDNPGTTRHYTLIGPFPEPRADLETWIDEWIETNYGEFM